MLQEWHSCNKFVLLSFILLQKKEKYKEFTGQIQCILYISKCWTRESTLTREWGEVNKRIKPVNPKVKQPVNIHWKDWCWRWSSNILTTWCEELTHWKRFWCYERLRAGGKGGGRGWDGWVASPTQWIWVWANSGRQSRTEKLGMLQSMGLKRVRHDWVTEHQQKQYKIIDLSKQLKCPRPTLLYSNP